MVFHALSMDYPWSIYGVSIEYLWMKVNDYYSIKGDIIVCFGSKRNAEIMLTFQLGILNI